MKSKIVVSALLLLVGSNVFSQTQFQTTEYNLSNALKSINASSAYARGYTGRDSVIGILDSGIDTSSNQFKDKILLIRDFTGSGTPIDRIGHGTHVAGIAAAARDGIGIHGVAYDAKLVIGKVTDNGMVGTNNLLTAASWINSTGVDVINMSLGWTLSQSYLSAKSMSNGVYQTKFTNTGSLPISSLFNTSSWAQALQGESVIVISAGNDGTKWSQGMAGLATLTDTKGSLVFGGRILIAGNYNPATNTINNTSNGAAHLCQTTVKGVMNTQYCADKYKTWEFYLMAPGTNILSTVPKTAGIPQKYDASLQPTGLATMTGTSMSAPVISGAAAIIHQMWPQMKGSNVAKLLLVTANKNIPNYNLYVHGQGLLDLEKATRPVGNLGIPTTGRLAGPSLSAVKPLVYTGGSASTGGLTKLMVVDSFERDFYTPGEILTARVPPREFNLAQALMVYDNKNPYVLFNNYTNKFSATLHNNMNVNVYKNVNDDSLGMFDVSYSKKYNDVQVTVSTGSFSEKTTWLGNSVGSFVGDGNNKSGNTYYTSLHVNKTIDTSKLYMSYNTGITFTKSSSENITSIGNVLSQSWTLGAERSLGNHTLGLMLYSPVTVYKAMADVVAPIGLDNEFNVIQNSKVNLSANVKELRMGLYHKFENTRDIKSMLFLEKRQNYRGQSSVDDVAFGLSMIKSF
jgi:subtilisin family serine protease